MLAFEGRLNSLKIFKKIAFAVYFNLCNFIYNLGLLLNLTEKILKKEQKVLKIIMDKIEATWLVGMQDEMLVKLLVGLRRLIFVVLITESPALASYPVHSVPMTAFVQIFWSLLGDLALSFKLRSRRPTD